jgi:purine-nucleoside phosphorylase
MEAFALFANARYLKKSAATILTVSDIIPTHEKISADERGEGIVANDESGAGECCENVSFF